MNSLTKRYTQGYGSGGGGLADYLGARDADRQAMLNYMQKNTISGAPWANQFGQSSPTQGSVGSTYNYTYNTPTTITNTASVPVQQEAATNVPNYNLPDPSAQQAKPKEEKPETKYVQSDHKNGQGPAEIYWTNTKGQVINPVTGQVVPNTMYGSESMYNQPKQSTAGSVTSGSVRGKPTGVKSMWG